MKTDFDKIITASKKFFSCYERYIRFLAMIENRVAERMYRSFRIAVPNMISFAKPFFCLRAMPGRRGSRS